MTAQTFVLLVIAIALGYLLASLLASWSNPVQRLLVVLLALALVVIWLQYGPHRGARTKSTKRQISVCYLSRE